MKYSVAAALPVMAALAAAQDIPTNIPSCGLACLATAAQEAGCPGIDITCMCEAYDVIANNSQPCLEAECSSSEIDDILQNSEALCSGVSDISGSMTLPVITETDLEAFPTATGSVTVTSPIDTETSPLTTTSTTTTGTGTDDDEETGTETDDEASPTATGEGAEEDEGSAAGRLQAAFGLAAAVAAAMAL